MNIRVAVRFVRTFAKGADTNTRSNRSILPLVSTAGIVAAMLLEGAVSTAFAAASLTPLGGLKPGGLYSAAHGVSADGSVVVGDTTNSFNNGEAFRWTSAGGMVGLGGVVGSQAYGVSGDGSVVVGSSGFGRVVYGGVRTEAFRWTTGGGMVSLGILPGADESDAYDVSADGSVIVGRNFFPQGLLHGWEAFRWTSGSGMVGLGYLPGGGFSSYASGVSADGSVVVGGSDSASGYQAFRWTAGDGMRALWDVLLSQGIDPAADGWTHLNTAENISADGNTIVGYGIRNDHTEAFVAVIPTIVPEPAAGALALVGASSILLLRRRSLGRPNKFSL
jgi:probable HAF family extracellular repeat protein